MGLDGLKMGFNMENIDFNGFRWIEMGFNMDKLIWILMGLDGWKMGFHMETYRF